MRDSVALLLGMTPGNIDSHSVPREHSISGSQRLKPSVRSELAVRLCPPCGSFLVGLVLWVPPDCGFSSHVPCAQFA